MTQCGKCKFWKHDQHRKEGYGVCICTEAIERAMNGMRHAYRFQERHKYELEKLYDPYVTDELHRCMFGEEVE